MDGTFSPNNSMSGGMGMGGGGSKKAVHVKWAGKTIALGTFPQGEAEDKCARAKALTRAWRSTMRPKPTREWVMLELERLGVRVVSGRLGRGKDDEDGDDCSEDGDTKRSSSVGGNNNIGGGNNNIGGGNNNIMNGNMGGMGNNMEMGNMMGIMGMGNNMGMNNGNHRPLVGGGPAAAFNAAREDHYRQMEEKNEREGRGGNLGNNSMNPMASISMTSGMGMGSGSGGGGNMSAFGLSVNPNQHYEMLKLHHMNLLNEIQETTLMMNLYQQQQLQQQQQMGNIGGGMGMGMMNQGGGGGMMNNQGGTGTFRNDVKYSRRGSSGNSSIASDKVSVEKANEAKTDAEKAAWLKKLKDDIAAREKEAAELEASLDPKRKKRYESDDEHDAKKAKQGYMAV